MGFFEHKETIEENDTVIVYISNDDLFPIIAKSGDVKQTKFGAVKHNEIIGKKFGCRYDCARGYVYLLFPNPEIWTLSLPHRTQILYTPDISRIIFELGLSNGKVVCESGTGSGSLSHAIARGIYPNGHLHTVEFHEERSKKARVEFEHHGLSKNITVYHRDVCEQGWPTEVDHKADAVFLDIPAPYKAIEHVKRALKLEGGEFCNFSPCIEQVQETCEKLREGGFTNIKTIECINSQTTVKSSHFPMPDFGVDYSELEEAGIMPKDCEKIGKYVKRLEKGSRPKTQNLKEEAGQEEAKEDLKLTECNFVVKSALAKRSQYGHTGYLTFARLPPRDNTL
ncbi:Oidioi.mRNA.OKI2018_I69.PAR.g12606.t1.cds [Oikopleura dioica]|uniref:tRNA (adenine(58)-N(1))-methyltransferase catalytic subunit TRMT61A n=1 Tax=Oikopleura dioica TaxID=34765 RepID=A0ABN7S0Q1_OIKDI|nr:Oidioi.mRNA.OKI2018_I69.PAR.g12606.t1.cds [Oikopleura dioica]